MEKARYIIDKDGGIYEMHQNDRLSANRLAVTQPEVLGKFVTLLSATLLHMENGQTLTIECTMEG